MYTFLKKDILKINKTKITKVCIDDFAIKKRKSYGTVMIDIQTYKIIDMINSREYEDVVLWLSTYPNIKVFSRDGSITYNSAINTTHPNAIQVSDRFHILKKLTYYCKDYLLKYLKNTIIIDSPNCNLQNIRKNLSKSEKNKILSYKENLTKALNLYNKGNSKSKICNLLNLDIRTLNKFLLSVDNKNFSFESKQEIIHRENVNKKQKKIDEVRLLHKKGLSLSAISRQLLLDSRTVKKYLNNDISPDLVS